MSSLVDPAVSVGLRRDELLVIPRHKPGEDHCVIPGGGERGQLHIGCCQGRKPPSV